MMKLYFVNIQTNLHDEDVVWAVETGHIASVNKSDASVFGGREELKETNANMGGTCSTQRGTTSNIGIEPRTF